MHSFLLNMFGAKVFELIKELDRNVDNIPAFNVKLNNIYSCFVLFLFINILSLFKDEIVRQVLDEMKGTFEQNHKDAYVKLKFIF